MRGERGENKKAAEVELLLREVLFLSPADYRREYELSEMRELNEKSAAVILQRDGGDGGRVRLGEDASDGWARHGVDSGGAAAEPGSKVRVLDLCASDLTLLLSAANNLLVRDAILETIIGALRRHRKGRGLAATCRLLAAVVECSQAV